MIKTFRGIMADGAQQRIRLSTKKGKIGYKIINFQAMPVDTSKLQQSVVKIFKVVQATVDDNIDFSDGNLLGAIYLTKNDDTKYPLSESTMFEQEIFNQDIYITHKDGSSGESANFYLELERIELSDNQAAVTTLIDIRLNPQVGA